LRAFFVDEPQKPGAAPMRRTSSGMAFLAIVILLLVPCLSMIFSENRFTLFGIML